MGVGGASLESGCRCKLEVQVQVAWTELVEGSGTVPGLGIRRGHVGFGSLGSRESLEGGMVRAPLL